MWYIDNLERIYLIPQFFLLHLEALINMSHTFFHNLHFGMQVRTWHRCCSRTRPQGTSPRTSPPRRSARSRTSLATSTACCSARRASRTTSAATRRRASRSRARASARTTRKQVVGRAGAARPRGAARQRSPIQARVFSERVCSPGAPGSADALRHGCRRSAPRRVC